MTARTDAHLEALYALTGTLAALQGRMTQMVDSVRGLVVNGVMQTGTVVLDANGQYTTSFEVPFGAVAVGNSGTTTVTIAGDGPQIAAPSQGTGVHKVAAGKAAIFPLAGRSLTIYGPVGATVQLGVYDRPQTAATFAPDAAGTLTSNDADAQANYAGASSTDAHSYGYNGATWDRVRTTGDNSDAVAVSALGELLAIARNSGFNGTTWDRLRTISAVGDGLGVLSTMQPSSSYATSSATNATAVLTFAAVAGQKHRISSASVSYGTTPTGAGQAILTMDGGSLIDWVGTTAPTGPACPPGGIQSNAVNTAAQLQLGAGGIGIVGWVFASKLTA